MAISNIKKISKIKVVWICHFANELIAKQIGIDSNLNFAPWIAELIKLFKDETQISLSIVAPNYYNNKDITFKIDNIDCYLYKYQPSIFPFEARNLSYNFITSRNSAEKIIKKIQPDLIHLHGSENPVYSASLLPLISKYPVLVTLQGYVCLSRKPNNLIRRYVRWNRIRIEREINTKASYFTIANEEGLNTLNTFTTTAKIYRDHYPTSKPDVSTSDFPIKKFDIVYYARISKDKGIEDFLKALRILKNSYPSIRSVIIGRGTPSYVEYITSLITKFDLTENVLFAGFQASQQDVFKLAAQARVYVLPTHFDGLPGSIREAMFMKLPVVAYAVGGIPSLNEDKECITLAEKQNINDLVGKINLVFDDTERTNRLVKNAYEVITNKYDNGKIYSNLIDIYRDILKSRKFKT